jgi:hypothetical protein
MGEVVHAKKAGGSGTAGELILAARYLQIGERRLQLRSMRLAVAGKGAVGAVDAFNAASVVSPLPVGLLGFAVTGSNIDVPAGSIAVAKSAQEFVFVDVSEESETIEESNPAEPDGENPPQS